MRRLIFFVMGFVIALALLVNMGCATAQSSIFEGMMNELEGPGQSYQVPEDVQAGWQPTSESGNHWVLRGFIGGKLNILARCDYTYIKIRGVERWKGRYYGMKDELNFDDPVSNHDLKELSGCVEWVKMFYYGDYSI